MESLQASDRTLLLPFQGTRLTFSTVPENVRGQKEFCLLGVKLLGALASAKPIAVNFAVSLFCTVVPLFRE